MLGGERTARFFMKSQVKFSAILFEIGMHTAK